MHFFSVKGHRVLNGHPEGLFTGEGMSPFKMVRFLLSFEKRGMASMRDFV